MRDTAVVIVNYRCAEDVLACVSSIERTASDTVAEIIVVDNASDDGSVERLRKHPNLQVVELPQNRGFAAGVNAGVAASKSPYVLILNPDTIVEPHAIEALREHLALHPKAGMTGPLLLDQEGNVRLDSYKALPGLRSLFVGAFFPLGRLLIGTRFHPDLRSRTEAARGGSVPRLCGAAMLVRRLAWEQAGPMDESFFLYFEEVEWQERVRRAGWEIEVVPEARVFHAVQGGRVSETWPPAFLRSAFLYLERQGRSRRTIMWTARAGFSLSRAVLALASLVTSSKEKAGRMRAGFRELAAVARHEGTATQ